MRVTVILSEPNPPELVGTPMEMWQFVEPRNLQGQRVDPWTLADLVESGLPTIVVESLPC